MDEGVPGAAYLVFQQMPDGNWKMLGEVARKPGMPARKSRTHAIMEATGGAARAGETYAAIIRSEWKVGLDWDPPT